MWVVCGWAHVYISTFMQRNCIKKLRLQPAEQLLHFKSSQGMRFERRVYSIAKVSACHDAGYITCVLSVGGGTKGQARWYGSWNLVSHTLHQCVCVCVWNAGGNALAAALSSFRHDDARGLVERTPGSTSRRGAVLRFVRHKEGFACKQANSVGIHKSTGHPGFSATHNTGTCYLHDQDRFLSSRLS